VEIDRNVYQVLLDTGSTADGISVTTFHRMQLGRDFFRYSNPRKGKERKGFAGRGWFPGVESDGLSQNWLIIWELKDLKSRLSKLANKYFSEDFEVCIVLINGFKQWFPFPLSENSSLTKILIYENQYFTSATLQLHYLSTTYLI
jgi:hypothetical protein